MRFWLLGLLLALGVGCKSKHSASAEDALSALRMEYAGRIRIDSSEHYILVRVQNPWDTARILHTYVLVGRETELPVGLPEGTLVRTPVEKALVYSSVHCGLLSELGAIDRIGGICDLQYIEIPEIQNRCASGRMVDAGNSMNPDIEKIHQMDQSDKCRRNEWIKYEAVLTALDDVRGAQFAITLDAPGIVEFDLISMIPEDAVSGIFRKDLFEALQAIKPGFVRFPGGCIVEGISLDNRYYWKNTVGDVKDRRYISNLWAFDDDWGKNDPMTKRPDAHYGQSFGLGFYEYFLLCELLGAKPLPVLNIGTACQFRSTEMVDSDSTEFEEYVQDALDLIEFANGPVDSKWGALRAKMGHPEPFGMDYLSVGNEQWETQYLDLRYRYERFEAAIHAKYPEIRLLGTAGPFMECSITEDAWKYYREKAKENPNFSYAVDEHYYVSPQWLYDHVAMYDDYPRDVAVFAGEYAAHTEARENSMESALAEAALLTGIEKNADVVKLASYAPLFNRIGHSQWKPDMIWFDDREVYLTPNYYVQKLFANHRGSHTVLLHDQDVELRKKGIYVSVSMDEDENIIVKTVNTTHQNFELSLEDADGAAVSASGKQWTLQGTGEIPEGLPEKSVVAEQKIQIKGSVTLPGQSVVVVTYR